MPLASLIVSIYAALVIIGGVIGFAKARSAPSLIAGILSGLALLAAGWALGHALFWGQPLAFLVIVLLLAVFSFRYFGKTPRVFMPGGLMAALSLLALIALILTRHNP